MRPFRLVIHALLFPCVYIAFLLIKLRPEQDEFGNLAVISKQDYYLAIGVFIATIVTAFYGSFLTKRLRTVDLQKRKLVAVACIATLVLVEAGLIYYLNTVSSSSLAPMA